MIGRKIDTEDHKEKLVHGGFPCQPYSSVGKRKGKDDDRDLWPEMFRIINELRPDWVVGENVANFANMELDRTLFDLENLGYETRTFILPASAVGAWHQRSRTFIVANADSKRWDSLEVHQESGCRSFCQNGFDKQAWDQERAEASRVPQGHG
ncbi:DNA cytosine methyltransferase [Enterococcus casseliflavus]|uniref:DNA cytosine methyltransferase n=1 Tax=Enterococcus casseliflavus TaxID=37734 RepID=UPI003D81037C